MKYASLPEQRRLAAELEDLRAEAGFEAEADRDTDLANAIIEDHLTPVLVHGMHSASTDWLGEEVADYTTADLHEIGTAMRAEASVWYATVTPGVRENRSELREQARGIARRLGSQYGSVANQAADIFLEYVGRLVVADGTDLAGDSSAAGPTGRPGGEDWSAGAPTLPEASGTTGTADDDEGLNAPEPSVSGPAPEEPTDQAPTSVESLPTEDTHNDPGNAAATSEIPPATAAYTWESAQQRSIRQYLGTEEGQEFPVPGERDPEQDGEAASSLPVGVDVTGAPDSFDNFMEPTPSKPAPSTRAPQLQGQAVKREAHPFKASSEVICSGKDGGEAGQPHCYWCNEHWDHDNHNGKEVEKNRRMWASRRTADRDPWAVPDQEDDDKGDDEKDTTWPEQKSLAPRTTEGSRHTAITTGPNPQGSFVYNPIEVEAKGYEEGFAYALTWSPGKPVPAAMSSAATIGNKYNDEYVTGYRNGVDDGIATLSSEFQGAYASAHKQLVLSTKTADANTRQFNDLEQEVAFPYTWSDTSGNPTSTGDRPGGGKGAADVASVPTPGSSVADYPQPGQANDPPVGTDATNTEPVLETEDTVPEVVGGGGEDHAVDPSPETAAPTDPAKLAYVRELVASRLGFSRQSAGDNPDWRPDLFPEDDANWDHLADTDSDHYAPRSGAKL
jgi:hypothetical protein